MMSFTVTTLLVNWTSILLDTFNPRVSWMLIVIAIRSFRIKDMNLIAASLQFYLTIPSNEVMQISLLHANDKQIRFIVHFKFRSFKRFSNSLLLYFDVLINLYARNKGISVRNPKVFFI